MLVYGSEIGLCGSRRCHELRRGSSCLLLYSTGNARERDSEGKRPQRPSFLHCTMGLSNKRHQTYTGKADL